MIATFFRHKTSARLFFLPATFLKVYPSSLLLPPPTPPTVKTTTTTLPTVVRTFSSNKEGRTVIGMSLRVVLLACALLGLLAYFPSVTHAAKEDDVSPSYRWGTYRPNVYFGVKARVPKSPLFGLLWTDADNKREMKIRHDCEERDQFQRYGWLAHDGRSFGIQELADTDLGVNITTEFVQLDSPGKLERWAVRVQGTSLQAEPKRNVSLMWYIASDDDSAPLTASAAGEDIRIGYSKALNGEASVRVSAPKSSESGLPPFSLTAHYSTGNTHPTIRTPEGHRKRKKNAKPSKKVLEKTMEKTYYMGVHKPSEDVWNVKPVVHDTMIRSIRSQLNDHMELMLKDRKKKRAKKGKEEPDPKQESMVVLQKAIERRILGMLPNKIEKNSNVFIFQQVLTLPFEVNFVLEEGDSPADNVPEREMSNKLETHTTDFDRRFEETFGLSSKGYSPNEIAFAKAALSNMIGGIGHFHGRGKVQMSPSEPVRESEVSTLLSTVPSRSFFPRGFLWDEGFHQHLVQAWDEGLSRDILSSWFQQITSSGWLPREQILGGEARARVPAEFQVQKPTIANPPTLLLALYKMTQSRSLEVEDDEFSEFVSAVFPALERQVEWYTSTQASKIPNAFAWKERTLDHCLASGLDDYPRASWLTEYEGHVDLHSWIVMMLRLMKKLSLWLAETSSDPVEVIGFHTKAEEYGARAATAHSSLFQLHWDASTQTFSDFALNPNTSRTDMIHHEGYVTLFPFILQLLDADSRELGATLDLLRDDNKVWSPFGILSLSRSDVDFGTKEDYWRGHIWMNINYLVLSALNHYAGQPGPHQERCASIYQELRTNIVSNVYNEYVRTGYLWEQYSSRNGRGRKSHPFTGWTGLVVLMMAEKY